MHGCLVQAHRWCAWLPGAGRQVVCMAARCRSTGGVHGCLVQEHRWCAWLPGADTQVACTTGAQVVCLAAWCRQAGCVHGCLVQAHKWCAPVQLMIKVSKRGAWQTHEIWPVSQNS